MNALFVLYISIIVITIATILLEETLKKNFKKDINKKFFSVLGNDISFKEIIFLFLIFLSLILSIGNTNNQDYQNYSNEYNMVTSAGKFPPFELGFSLLMFVFSKIGLNYHFFLGSVIVTGMILNICAIKKISKNKLIPLLLMLIFPFLLNVIQLRVYLASAFLIIGVLFLLQKKHIKTVVFFLLAVSFQKISLVLIPLIILTKLNSKIFSIISIIISIVLFYLVQTGEIIKLAQLVMNDYQLYYYFSATSKLTITGLLVITISQYFIPLTISYIYRNKDYFSDFMYKYNLYILMFFPLIILSYEFTRIPRMIMLLNYILWSNIFMSIKNRKYKLLFFVLVIFQVIISWYALQGVGVNTIFANNIFV